MTELNKSNYRTAVMEKAIELLSEMYKGSREFLDDNFKVRKVLDRLSGELSVLTGWKDDPEDPSKKVPVYKKVCDIWQYPDSVVETVTAQVRCNISNDLSKYNYPTNGKFNAEDFKEFVKSLKTWAPFVRADNVYNFVSSLLKTICYTQNMDETEKFQKINILQSPVKGGGKTTFLNAWLKSAQDAGVYAEKGEIPLTLDTNSDPKPFTKCAMIVQEDIQSQPAQNAVMSIGRKEDIKVVAKYEKPYSAKCISEVWAATNIFLKSDRVLNLIQCNSYDIESLKRSDLLEKFRTELELPDVVTLHVPWHKTLSLKVLKVLTQNFCSREEVVDNVLDERVRKNREMSTVSGMQFLLETLEQVKSAPIDFRSVSVARISKYLSIPTDKQQSIRLRLSRTLKALFTKHLIERTVNSKLIDYEQWDLSELINLSPEDLFTSKVTKSQDVFDEIEETRKVYDELIARAEEFFPPEDPEPTHEKESTEEEAVITEQPEIKETTTSDNSLTTSETDDVEDILAGIADEIGLAPKTETFLKDKVEADWKTLGKNQGTVYVYKKDQYANGASVKDDSIFVVSNPVKRETIVNKVSPTEICKGEYLQECNFVFECDESTIEEQKQMIENLPDEVKKSIISVTFSGNKSIHVLLHTNNTCHEARKAIWKELSKKYFGDKADEQCSNNSRLTRKPNSVRDNGVEQTCYYFNTNPTALDVSAISKQIEYEKRLEQICRQAQADFKTNTNYKKQDLTVEVLQKRKYSDARDNAIRLLQGNCSHGPEAMSGLKYLFSTGYDEFDIRANVPQMSWTDAEFNKMIQDALKNVNN